MFILIVVILTSVCVIVSGGVSSLITALLSSIITLLIPYNNSDDYDGLSVALDIKPGVCSLGGYNPNIYDLSV